MDIEGIARAARRRLVPGLMLVSAQTGALDGAVAAETFLDQVTVTTSRRAAALDDLAGNLSRLSQDDIRFLRVDHVSEAINRLPGLNIQRGNGQEHLTAVRSPVLTGGAGAGSFLYLEDGVPLRAAGFANVNGLFEAHSELAGGIEVVRGPGSALYGSNAVHGLINLLTPAPARGTAAMLEGSWGSFDRGQLHMSASGARGAHGVFAGLTLTREGGFREHAGLDQQKATLRYDFDGGETRLRATLSGHNLDQETAGFIRGLDAYLDRALARSNPNREAFRDAWALRTAVRVDHDLSDKLTLSVTPYGRWNEMNFLMHFLPSRALEENGHKSIGVLSSVAWSLQETSTFLIGADVEATEGFLRETQSRASFGTFPSGTHYDYDVTAVVTALYGHGEWQVSDGVRIVGGVRWEHAHYDYDNNTASGTVGRFRRPDDRTDSYSVVTPKLGVVWNVNAAASLFANYARGARAPQTTDLYRLQINQSVGDIEEEKLDGVEIGARGEVGGASYQASAFYMIKRNFFFRDTDGFNVSDGKTEHKGVELEAVIPLHETLDLAAAVSYARHTYDFTNPVTANSTESITAGNDVDTAPRVTANVRLIWKPVDAVRAEIEWVHAGRYFTDASNLHDYPGHDLLNARLVWRAGDSVDLFVNARNLTDKAYAERADFFFGSERYFPGETRAFEGGVNLHF